jgi:CRISPR-associated protein Csm3
MALTYKELKGKIVCKTGLRIGGKESMIEIGGVDNPIIRNPLDDFPYIPGSSLKGKMRFLLEHYMGKIENKENKENNGSPHSCKDKDCLICKIFGKSAEIGKTPESIEIGRAIFRDAFLTEESKEKLKELSQRSGYKYVERKVENMIDRKSGTAKFPRDMERVPAGTEFEFSIVFRIFENENADEMIETIKTGFELLQKDALGSSGSRGYGKIEIKDLEIK